MPQTPEHKAFIRLKNPSPGRRSFIPHTHALLLPVQLFPLHKGAQVFLEFTTHFQHFTHSHINETHMVEYYCPPFLP